MSWQLLKIIILKIEDCHFKINRKSIASCIKIPDLKICAVLKLSSGIAIKTKIIIKKYNVEKDEPFPPIKIKLKIYISPSNGLVLENTTT